MTKARLYAEETLNSQRNGMRSAAPTPKMTEAALANQSGRECSSYAWQVRQGIYAFCIDESQIKSALWGGRSGARMPV
jgi:hypothetical protein